MFIMRIKRWLASLTSTPPPQPWGPFLILEAEDGSFKLLVRGPELEVYEMAITKRVEE